MKEVQTWLNEEGSYNKGLALYMQHPAASKNLIRILGKGESPSNRRKLAYELKKVYKHKPVHLKSALKPDPSKVNTSAYKEKEMHERSADNFHGKVRLQDLHPSLHERFILQKQTFYKIWKLHYHLEDLPSDEHRERAMRQIMEGWELINAIWKEIDYWQAYKQLLPKPDTFNLEKLSPEQLAQRKRTVHSNISKYEKKVQKLKEELQTEKDEDARKALEQKITKATGTLGKQIVRLAEINRKINE